jgi:formylmethanofuran dehydrogenase subunit E
MPRHWTLILALAASALGQNAVDQKLKAVADVHGAAGVFAVAGYRMGEYALRELKLPRGSFAIEVVHQTPNEVQWSCIADGLQAATGASAGKLNLRIAAGTRESVKTIVTDRKTGRTLTFELDPAFIKRFLDLPYEKQPAAGRDVAEMPENLVFRVHPGTR